jgi:hypothetical protein
MKKNSGPTEAQLAAAIEGARDMSEASRGAGRAGTKPESRVATEDTEPVDPDEVVQRETAVFIPGTHGQKPRT